MRIEIKKHIAIIGETQSGKTVLAREIFNANPIKSIYIDIEDMGEIENARTIDRNNSVYYIETVIQHYDKIRYVPSPYPEIAKKEMKALWKILLGMNTNICVFADEIQNYGDDKKNVFDVYAVRGLKHGIHLVTISQRPAFVSKTIMTQSPLIVFFDIGTFEQSYFRTYSLPYDDILLKFNNAPEHSFVIYERGKPLSGPFVLTGVV